ncbi:MAG: bacteriocin family protein [Planctomycetes bacterium]|nr:bacteriocin family protein [Planctomycetota bacterium]
MASEEYLNRGDAPFGERVWEEIDKAVVEAAKGQLTGRRLLRTISPDGLGLKTLPFRDTPISDKTVAGVTVTSSCMIPVAMIQSEFSLSARDVAAFEESGVPLDINQVVKAALAVARQEDQLIFEGFPPLRTVGLLNTPGARSVKLRPWSQPGDAVGDIINAVAELDRAGFPGPYSLALTPASYNHLFQLYPHSELTELEHVRQIATDLVVKAPAVSGGGLLIDTSGPYASIVLGQDMATSFTGPGPARYEFAIIESLALWVQVPEAICVLK